MAAHTRAAARLALVRKLETAALPAQWSAMRSWFEVAALFLQRSARMSSLAASAADLERSVLPT
jgi:hypothetical protein